MKGHSKTSLFLVVIIAALFASAFSQQPDAAPTPPDDSVKVRTDEVRLNVMAQTAQGRFVSTLKPDDLLIVEEGDPQMITSMRHLSANVLFLLDTGGDLNLVKSTSLTKLIAAMAIASLAPDDSVSVIEYNDKVEIVSDWTTDRDLVYPNIESKLFSSKRSRFAEGLAAAVKMFSERPLENRHIVIVSDGVDTVSERPAVRSAMQNLLAANISVHVISYTKLEEQAAGKSSEIRNWKGRYETTRT